MKITEATYMLSKSWESIRQETKAMGIGSKMDGRLEINIPRGRFADIFGTHQNIQPFESTDYPWKASVDMSGVLFVTLLTESYYKAWRNTGGVE